MKKIFFAANILLALSLVSCNQKAEQKAETAAPATEPEKMEVKLSDLASNKDYVCGMPLEEGSIADTFRYEGKLYGFCASECKDSFALKAATYLAQK